MKQLADGVWQLAGFHQGSSHRICTELSIPFWVGAGDDDAAGSEAGR